MDKSELLEITGGGFSASMLNAIVRMATILLELGRTLGTVISRTINHKPC